MKKRTLPLGMETDLVTEVRPRLWRGEVSSYLTSSTVAVHSFKEVGKEWMAGRPVTLETGTVFHCYNARLLGSRALIREREIIPTGDFRTMRLLGEVVLCYLSLPEEERSEWREAYEKTLALYREYSVEIQEIEGCRGIIVSVRKREEEE